MPKTSEPLFQKSPPPPKKKKKKKNDNNNQSEMTNSISMQEYSANISVSDLESSVRLYCGIVTVL